MKLLGVCAFAVSLLLAATDVREHIAAQEPQQHVEVDVRGAVFSRPVAVSLGAGAVGNLELRVGDNMAAWADTLALA